MIKRPVLLVPFLAALAILIDSNLSLFGYRTDLASFLVYWFGLTHSGAAGMAFGVGMGYMEDSLLSPLIGPGLLAGGAIGYMASFFSHTFFRWTPLLGFLVASILTFVGGMAEFASLSVFADLEQAFRGGLLPLAAQSLLNGILAAFFRPGEA